jgi:hypothetical protein
MKIITGDRVIKMHTYHYINSNTTYLQSPRV